MKKFLPLLLVIAFAGCKKDTDELLTRSWKIASITSRSNGVTTQENLSMCTANRIWTFREDKSFLNEPSPNCTPNGTLDFPLTGTWSLLDNKTLKMEAQAGSVATYVEAQIVALKKSKLVLRKIAPVGGGFGGGGLRPEVEITWELVPR